MNYVELHLGDYLKDTSRLTLAEHGAYLKLMVEYYSSEGPLPADVAELHRICVALTAAERATVSKVAELYFPVASDGLRHKNRCDEEIQKYRERVEAEPEKKANQAERQRRARDRRKSLFEQLRALGVTPKFDATTTDLEAILAEAVTRDAAQKEAGSHAPVTRDDTATRPHAPHAIKELPSTNVLGADGPLVDPLWHTGLAFLQRKGVPEKQARALLGQVKARLGDLDAAALLATAEAQDITDPAPWLMAASSKRAKAAPSIAADFRGKTYAGTADADLPESLR